jgi:hypothetical protein
MKSFLWLTALAFLCLSSTLSAQSPNRVTIRGIVADTTGAEIAYATVMLLNPKDSTLVNFTRSDDKGGFAFRNMRNTPYILKISYIGFLPHQQTLTTVAADPYNLGKIKLKPISKELMEVVIHTAKAPLRIHGDTIEYDASTFKVPPGSTVEDLLRRLPGIDVDADGNIKAQGKDVKRVYVDGKTFFGDDPKAATKNLGAETISKVQVYNEKSEQAKLTGVDDGKKEKAMNLELKEAYKKGAFGKVTVAGGTSGRWAGRGNYNRFNDQQQLSFIGYGNNINQTGVNWEDYGEFKGQNAFNDFDNGDFGFSSGGRRYYMFDDGGALNFFDGRGFTRNFGGGVNYNFDNKKTKLSTSYFYNQTTLRLYQTSLRKTFLTGERSYSNEDTLNQSNYRHNHTLAVRLEQNLDSNNVLIVKGNLRLSNSNVQNNQTQLFSDSNNPLPLNSLNLNNATALTPNSLNSTAIFRHRFKKKGRSLAASLAYNNSKSDGTENLFSINRFFTATSFTEQVRQLNNDHSTTNQVKFSALYTEPLSKIWFLESFYNHTHTGNQVNHQVANGEGQSSNRIDSLSVYYDNMVIYNRLGTSIRYSNKGVNVAVGFAGQQLELKGQYARDRGLPLLVDPVNRVYRNLVPNVSSNIQVTDNFSIGTEYGYGVTEPALNDLQPVPNVSNPAFRVKGNPGLSPERAHNLNVDFNFWSPASLANFSVGVNSTFYDNQIVYNQTIEAIDSVGIRTTTQPGNVSGGRRVNVYLWSNYPLIKTKLTVNMNGSLESGSTSSYVNSVRNQTDSHGFNGSLGLNLTPTPKLILNAGANLGISYIQYSIQTDQNQKILNGGFNTTVKWQFAPKFFFESNFNYTSYRNDHLNFNQKIPIWNASVRRLFGKNNRVEMRLAAFDLLNRHVSITQTGTQNYVLRNVASTLARYYMLSVSYNIRGYEDKLKKNDWF